MNSNHQFSETYVPRLGNRGLARIYSGSCIFTATALSKVLFDGGHVEVTSAARTYMFFLTDNLGSVRVVADENGTVRQVNQYYPYGELIEDANMAEGTSDNRYRFTGKELATETGLYDFSARYLETSMGRFTT
ncbi:MAG: hypothetical protein MJY72_02120, partial [Bacteroidales bacterium]|nr:hypothetical protein [Bacteroidales bacterium]